MINNCPNLDALSIDELGAFAKRHANGNGHTLLMIGADPYTVRRAVADLARYASNKKCAMKLREQGNIDMALGYETVCDQLYRSIPEEYRSW